MRKTIAKRLVAGVDVWLNTPEPPLEASGTSGMKAAINGVLQLSVLDGWWAEAYDGTNGWAIDGEVDPDHEAQDARHADALFDLHARDDLPVVLEVQIRPDPRKKFAWPKYLTQRRSPQRPLNAVVVVSREHRRVKIQPAI